ncbi:MAG: hypothetical protein HDT43_03240 [Ruminococcaceae bacterium]|nr:hypothetical protein [Oscillospiraceae bacterium]
MNRRLWSSIIAAALVLGTISGCSTDIESVPTISSDNPALASIAHSSSDPDTASSIPSSSRSTSSTASASSSTSSKSEAEKVGDKLKETLDGYEGFIKEYTEYIKNYKNEDSSRLQEYAKKSDEITELLENYDDSGLNKKEQIYLSDVKYRVNKMLSEVENKLPEWNDASGQYVMSTSTTRPPITTVTTPTSSSSRPRPSSSSSRPWSSSASTGTESTTGPSEEPVSSVPSNETSGGQGISSTVESTIVSDYSLPEIVDVPDPDTSSLFTDYTRKWAYNQITTAQKAVYARLFESAKNNTEDINVTDLKLSVDDTTIAYWAFDYDNANFLTLGSGYSYSYDTGTGDVVSVAISYGRSSGNVPTAQFEAAAQSVIAEAQQMGSDYERLKYIHDWLVNNTTYTNNGTASRNEADGPMVYGQAVCEGYSKAFMYLAQSLGYECVCVAGYADGDHMWNMVKMGGNWYHVDVTWDDPISSSGPMLRYNYFLVSDSTIGRDHRLDNYFAVPTAPYDYQQ